VTRSLEAVRCNQLDIAIRDKDKPDKAIIAATCPNERALELMVNTLNLAFELMDQFPDKAEGITLQ
jgi:hypothetical protein